MSSLNTQHRHTELYKESITLPQGKSMKDFTNEISQKRKEIKSISESYLPSLERAGHSLSHIWDAKLGFKTIYDRLSWAETRRFQAEYQLQKLKNVENSLNNELTELKSSNEEMRNIIQDSEKAKSLMETIEAHSGKALLGVGTLLSLGIGVINPPSLLVSGPLLLSAVGTGKAIDLAKTWWEGKDQAAMEKSLNKQLTSIKTEQHNIERKITKLKKTTDKRAMPFENNRNNLNALLTKGGLDNDETKQFMEAFAFKYITNDNGVFQLSISEESFNTLTPITKAALPSFEDLESMIAEMNEYIQTKGQKNEKDIHTAFTRFQQNSFSIDQSYRHERQTHQFDTFRNQFKSFRKKDGEIIEMIENKEKIKYRLLSEDKNNDLRYLVSEDTPKSGEYKIQKYDFISQKMSPIEDTDISNKFLEKNIKNLPNSFLHNLSEEILNNITNTKLQTHLQQIKEIQNHENNTNKSTEWNISVTSDTIEVIYKKGKQNAFNTSTSHFLDLQTSLSGTPTQKKSLIRQYKKLGITLIIN